MLLYNSYLHYGIPARFDQFTSDHLSELLKFLAHTGNDEYRPTALDAGFASFPQVEWRRSSTTRRNMNAQKRTSTKKPVSSGEDRKTQSTDSVRQSLQRILETLRKGGIAEPAKALEQIALLAYMKLLDEREPLAGSKIFPGNESRYRWSNFLKYARPDLHTLLTNQVLPYLSTLDNVAPVIAEYYRGSSLEIENPAVLDRVFHGIDSIDFWLFRPDEMGVILEELLSNAELSTQFRTPRPLRQFMVQVLDPKPGETIYDPACGTGGFLTEVVAQLEKNQSTPKADRTEFAQLLYGTDTSRRMIRLARMNLELQGIPPANVQRVNPVVAYGGLLPREMERKYDLVLCAPPFDGSPPPDEIRTDLPVPSSRLEILFLEIAMVSLRPGGRAAIIVPDSLLFGAGKTSTEVRRILLTDYQVLAVFPLPAATLKAHSATKASVVVLQNPLHATNRKMQTRTVWFSEVDLENPAQTLDHWSAYAASNFEQPPGIETGRVVKNGEDIRHWWASIDTIAKNDFDLSAFRYKPREDQLALTEPKEQLAELKKQLDLFNRQLIESAKTQEALRTPKFREGIQTRKLADLVDITSGTTPSTNEPEYWNGTTPWVSPKDMKRPIIEDTIDHVSDMAVQKYRRALVDEGTLIVVARSMILEKKLPLAITASRLMISQDILALKPKPDSGVTAWYLFAYLTAIEDQILAGMQGTTHGSRKLPTALLNDLDIPIFSRKKMHQVEQLGMLSANLHIVVSKIKQLTETLFPMTLRAVFQELGK